jgi:N-acyl-phosphatidylethanolamine-hydrolysing phospholipase D
MFYYKTFIIILAMSVTSSCVPATILKRNVAALVSTPRAIPDRIKRPARTDVRLAALWVGHATVLIQLDDKLILTDPVLTQTVGAGFSRRLVEPGIAPEDMPEIDVAVVSHMHLDHLSLGTLELLEGRIRQLLLPTDGLRYVPDHEFPIDEVARWQTVERGGVRITAVPVKHPGWRYGADRAWMTRSATAWVFEYNGMTVYFGGDTAYEQRAFTEVAARFPRIDLAILPIGPVEPDSFARATHVDGREALQAFVDLGAAHMLPMHYDTFAHGIDPAGYAVARLRAAMEERGVGDDRVHIIPIGAQYTADPAR